MPNLPHNADSVSPFEWAVVVPTRNRSDRLRRLVTGMEQQVGCPDFELVVVDDCSTDDTPTVLAGLAASSRLRLIARRQETHDGAGAARNLGWRSTRARMVAFTDDDCVPQPLWLRKLAEAATDADIVQGTTRPSPAQTANLGPFSRTLSVDGLSGLYETCNIAYSRELLSRLGGFDPRLGFAGEDTDLGLRAVETGARVGVAPEAIVYHDIRPSSFRDEVRSLSRWHTIPQTVAKHPQLRQRCYRRVFWKRTHASVLAAVAGVGLAVTAPRSTVARTAAGLAVTPYLVDRLSRAPLPNVGMRDRVTLLPAAAVIDLVEVAVCVAGSLEGRTLLL